MRNTQSETARMHRKTRLAKTRLAKTRLAALPLFVLALSGLVDAASMAHAAAPTTCTTSGINWNNDPVFRAALPPSERERGIREIACSVETSSELIAGDIKLRLTMGTLFDERLSGPKLGAALINIEKMDGTAGKQVARVFLGPDELDGQIRFQPQAVNLDGTVLIRLSPRHPWLFRLDGEKVTASSAFAWRSTIDDAFPDDARSGANLSVDLEKMEGRVAVRKIATDPSNSYPSAFEANRLLRARLVWREGKLTAVSTEIIARKEGEEPFLDQMSGLDETARKSVKNPPGDVEPCSLGAWSEDTDPKGLNVRAAPSASAKVVGIIPPPRKMPKEREAFSEPVKSEFRIIGFREGWFLIENISAPGVAYGEAYPRNLPQPYKGRGWVSSRMVGAAYAYGGIPSSRLYLSPHADAGYKDALDRHGNPIGGGMPPARILACSGWWGLVETREQQRGWVRTLCSNQVTNCS